MTAGVERRCLETTAYNRRTGKREPVTLDVEIDWHSFGRRLADKAFRNRTAKTTMLNSIVKAFIRLSS